MTSNKRDLAVAVGALLCSALSAVLVSVVFGDMKTMKEALAGIDTRITAASVAATARAANLQPVDRKTAVDQFAPFYEGALEASAPRWLGVTTQQSPDDCWTMQEILFETKPDLIVEAGTFRGGLTLFLATVLPQVNSEGKILTLDINSIKHVDARSNDLFKSRVEFIQGNSLSPAIIADLKKRTEGRKTFVILDTMHVKDHVLKELRLYSNLVSVGGYLFVHDTNNSGHPLGSPAVPGPWEAVAEFLKTDDRFQIDSSRERFLITLAPSGYLKRVK